MSGPQREPKHFAYIDAVRGAAFLAVLASHAASCVGDFPKSTFLKAGGYGVQLFFLASAITLCGSLEARSRSEVHPVYFFYLRRLFRIAPLFWLAIVFYWTIPSVLPPMMLSQWAPSGVHPSYFVLTALFLHGWHPYTFNSIVPGGWSIAVEMNFYVLFPILFKYLNSAKRAAVAVVIGIVLIKLENHFRPWMHSHLYPGTNDSIFWFFNTLWFPAQIVVFLTGIFTYHAMKTAPIISMVRSRFWSSITFFCCALALPGFVVGSEKGVPSNLLVVFAMAAIIITVSANGVPLVVNRVICYIGKLSYSCYLVHFAAMAVALRILDIHLTTAHPLQDAGSKFANLTLFLALFLMGLLFTLPVSALTLYLVESPGISLGRSFIHRLSGKANLPAVRASRVTVNK